jgi:hypothetical protein
MIQTHDKARSYDLTFAAATADTTAALKFSAKAAVLYWDISELTLDAGRPALIAAAGIRLAVSLANLFCRIAVYTYILSAMFASDSGWTYCSSNGAACKSSGTRNPST